MKYVKCKHWPFREELYECDDNELENFLNNPCKSVDGTCSGIITNERFFRSNYFPKNNVKFITDNKEEIHKFHCNDKNYILFLEKYSNK